MSSHTFADSRQGRPPLEAALLQYDAHQRRRFHVPAHAGRLWETVKNGTTNRLLHDPYRYDLTELDGLDVLSEPSGCLKEAQDQVAGLFGAKQSFFLVNGATVGILAAILAAVRPGDKVLLPRNVHRSVLSALILTGAEPVWCLPERLPDWGLWGQLSPETVRENLSVHPDIKALVVTSPTYEGIGSDIATIGAICRQANVTLIVDEAHGSLWPIASQWPVSAVQAGADAVIHSIHKSGGCLTQGALAHLPHASRIEPEAFQQALNLVQTTSPSYLLMSNLEAACHFLASDAGQERIARLYQHINALRRELPNELSGLHLFEASSSQHAFWDPAKLYWIHPACTGEEWGACFEENLKLAYESASPYGVLYLANLGLEADDFSFFRQALKTGDALFPVSDDDETPNLQEQLERQNPAVLQPEMALLPRDAFFAAGAFIPSEAAAGRIAKEAIVHCPPGIPVLLPGERIQALHLPLLPEKGVRVVR